MVCSKKQHEFCIVFHAGVFGLKLENKLCVSSFFQTSNMDVALLSVSLTIAS